MAVTVRARPGHGGLIDRLRPLVCGIAPENALDDAWHGHCKGCRLVSLRTSLLTWLCACSLLAASGCTRAAESTGERGTTLVTRTPEEVPGRAQFERGAMLTARADYAGAEHALVQALTSGYPAARVLPLLLEVCRKADHLSAGVDYATPYLRLHPDDYRLRYRVAELLHALGRFGEARRELEGVIDAAPNYGPAHLLLAVTLRDQLHDANAAAEHLAVY